MTARKSRVKRVPPRPVFYSGPVRIILDLGAGYALGVAPRGAGTVFSVEDARRNHAALGKAFPSLYIMGARDLRSGMKPSMRLSLATRDQDGIVTGALHDIVLVTPADSEE